MQINHNRFIYFFVFILSGFYSQAQSIPTTPPNEYSPYSRFGYGQPQLNGLGISQGMAGASTAFVNDSFPCVYINASNPASLASTYASALEFGMQGKRSTFSAPNSTNKSSSANFHYASLAVPLKRFGGLGLGILPETQTGYQLAASDSINDFSYAGRGGLFRTFFGIGVTPFHKIQRKYKRKHSELQIRNYEAFKRNSFLLGILNHTSIGANANYYFGTIVNQSRNFVRFDDGTTTRSTKILSNDITGFSFSYGAITGFTVDSIKTKKDSLRTRKKLKQSITVHFGYHASIGSRMRNNEDYFAYNELGIGSTSVLDTIGYIVNDVNRQSLPTFQKLGIGIKWGEKWHFLADYGTEIWSKQVFTYQANVFKDMNQYAFGLQYTPSKRSVGKGTFTKRITYRAGYRQNDGYLLIDNTGIKTQAFHAGVSLPLGRMREYGFLHANFEYGTIGIKTNRLIQESYVKMVLGFSFNDVWFIKPKVD
jgi:hypothetical protein